MQGKGSNATDDLLAHLPECLNGCVQQLASMQLAANRVVLTVFTAMIGLQEAWADRATVQ